MDYGNHLLDIYHAKASNGADVHSFDVGMETHQGPNVHQQNFKEVLSDQYMTSTMLPPLPQQQHLVEEASEPTAIPLPVLPDHVWATEEGQPYNPFWMSDHGISEDFIRGWLSRKRVQDLFRQGALCLGDRLNVNTVSDANIQVERSVSVTALKSPGLVVEIVDPSTGSLTGISKLCSGIGDILEFVKFHFHDKEILTPGITRVHEAVHVSRNGQDLGSLTDIRQRFVLWALMQAKRLDAQQPAVIYRSKDGRLKKTSTHAWIGNIYVQSRKGACKNEALKPHNAKKRA
ncbi:MAG: hypothetical protein Q9218_007529, partial [Villophora microphyllina]